LDVFFVNKNGKILHNRRIEGVGWKAWKEIGGIEVGLSQFEYEMFQEEKSKPCLF
jgi:hypothetical protein